MSYRDAAFPAPTRGASPVGTEVTPRAGSPSCWKGSEGGVHGRVPAVSASELHAAVSPSEAVVRKRPTLCNKIVFILREAIFYYDIKYMFYIL